MEKNVPLLKLIHDPWSIKTMLSSRFTSVPLHPRAPQQYIQPPSGEHRGRGGGGGAEGDGGGAGVRETPPRLRLCARVRMYCCGFSSLVAVGRCWCSGDCRNLHSSQTAEPDPQVPKVTAGEEEEEEKEEGGGARSTFAYSHWLAAQRPGASSPFPVSSCVGYFLPQIFFFPNSSSSPHEFERSTFESSPLVSVVSVYRVVLLL